MCDFTLFPLLVPSVKSVVFRMMDCRSETEMKPQMSLTDRKLPQPSRFRLCPLKVSI